MQLILAGLNTTLTYSGSYEIRIHGKQWFESAAPFVVADGLRYSVNGSAIFRGQVPAMDRQLLLKSQEPSQGSDVLGRFTAFDYVYFAGDTRMDLGIRSYQSAVVFSQVWVIQQW